MGEWARRGMGNPSIGSFWGWSCAAGLLTFLATAGGFKLLASPREDAMLEAEGLIPIPIFFQKTELVVTFLLVLLGIAFGNRV